MERKTNNELMNFFESTLIPEPSTIVGRYAKDISNAIMSPLKEAKLLEIQAELKKVELKERADMAKQVLISYSKVAQKRQLSDREVDLLEHLFSYSLGV